jgi:predicted AlkP superfamily pyrophosphatase or phosphodiesterase
VGTIGQQFTPVFWYIGNPITELERDLQAPVKSGFWLTAITAITIVFLAACQQQPIVLNEDAADVTATAPGETVRGSGGVNAAHQQAKPYLILVSIDGFRWDYMDLYPTPNIDRIAATGSRAERLLPVFPTLTFPNHYSIATGLYPANHGLVANDFPGPARDSWYSLKNRETVKDPAFYAGEPIWVTAETQGMVAASFYWVGTEAPVMGVSPTHWRSYDKGIPGEDRVDQVLAWMAEPVESRPHLYTLYFERVDDYSHWYGPNSAESINAIKDVDAYIGRLLDGLQRLPHANRINIILVSDHGQSVYHENPQPLTLDEYVNLDGLRIIEGGSYLFIHFDQDDPARAREIADTVNTNWDHGQAYVPADTPEQWHVDDNPRFPDVILVPDSGFAVLSSSGKEEQKITAGDHGWAPEAPAMHGFFVASGPNIKPGLKLGPVNSVDIYPLMLSILGLDAPDKFDGDPCRLAAILIPPATKPGFSSEPYKCD